MHFQIHKSPDRMQWLYTWTLQKATGEIVCRSAGATGSEREIRTAIAAAKKSMAGASRCRVVSPNA